MTSCKEPPGLVDLASEIRAKCEQLVSLVLNGDMAKAKETLNEINRLIKEFERRDD